MLDDDNKHLTHSQLNSWAEFTTNRRWQDEVGVVLWPVIFVVAILVFAVGYAIGHSEGSRDETHER